MCTMELNQKKRLDYNEKIDLEYERNEKNVDSRGRLCYNRM